jgi:Protein of unknown function DUF262
MPSIASAKLDARSLPLDDLVANLRDGRVRLPDFQRKFRWTTSDVIRLFDSIYRGYPIGTLLFWKRSAPAGEVRFGGASWSVPAFNDALWVIDGQQRITSLTLTVLDDLRNLNDRRFSIYFDPAEEEFHSALRSSSIPVSTAFDLSKVLSWAAENGLSDDHREKVFGLAKRLREYQIPAYLVDTDDEKAVREIFDRMNNFGRRLKKSDVFDALYSAMEGGEFRRLSWVGDAAVELGFGELDDQLILYTVLATRGTDVLRDFHKEFVDDEDRIRAYSVARDALRRSIQFLLIDAGIPHARLIPHQHLLVALVRFFHLYPEPSPRARVLLRRWFWRAAVLGPNLRGGTTGTLRQTVGVLSPSNDLASVGELLSLTAGQGQLRLPPRTNIARLTTADTRMSLAALLSLRPLSPSTGQPIEVDALLGSERAPLPQILLADVVGERSAELANRLLLVEDEMDTDPPGESLLKAVRKGDFLIGESHLIDEKFVHLVDEGSPLVALDYRAAAIDQFVVNYVDSRAEWDLSDRPGIADLLGEEPDDA